MSRIITCPNCRASHTAESFESCTQFEDTKHLHAKICDACGCTIHLIQENDVVVFDMISKNVASKRLDNLLDKIQREYAKQCLNQCLNNKK